MEPLAPLRQAQDQAIISTCLAQAMAASGAQTFLTATAPSSAPTLRRELVQRARAMREAARGQSDLARDMLKTNAEILASARRTWRPTYADERT